MKTNYFKYIFGLMLLTSVYSCKKSLDINENPNEATSATVNTVLPTSIVATAANVNTFNNSIRGSQLAGYYANGGGVSGWGSIISYNYVTGDGTALWANTYDLLEDVKYVIDNSEDVATLSEFNAAAKVIKAFNYQMLVDTYNDVPYTEALMGAKILQPKYDKAADIYKSLADLCDEAITKFKAVTTKSPAFATSDPLFAGDPVKWAQFAQTLKLKLIIRAGSKVAFTNTTFDGGVGFLTQDAIVQPGYVKQEGKQNPTWNSWAYTFSGAAVSAASQYPPTPWIVSFYNGTKLRDAARLAVVFKAPVPVVNQLGYQGSDAGRGAAPSSWFKGTNASTFDKIGILKGPDAGQPIFLAAESYLLQSEGNLRGLVSTGTALSNFENGVIASFNYLYKDNTGAVTAGKNAAADFATYKTDNANSYLVNFNLAANDAQRLEAIITQKYIAFNMLFGHEAWNEYVRTGYPTIVPGSDNKTLSFASITSEATTPDKLPTRILYPITEYQFNAANVPGDINKYSTKIFWAK